MSQGRCELDETGGLVGWDDMAALDCVGVAFAGVVAPSTEASTAHTAATTTINNRRARNRLRTMRTPLFAVVQRAHCAESPAVPFTQPRGDHRRRANPVVRLRNEVRDRKGDQRLRAMFLARKRSAVMARPHSDGMNAILSGGLNKRISRYRLCRDTANGLPSSCLRLPVALLRPVDV